MFLAFDPGHTTGWALFDITGEIKDTGQIEEGVEGVTTFLMELNEPVSTVIVESYMVRPDDHSVKANVGSKLETVQVIGVIRGWSHTKKAKVVMQPPSVKKMGELYAGWEVKGNHRDSHWKDAVLHGIYYLVKIGKRKPKGAEGYDMV